VTTEAAVDVCRVVLVAPHRTIEMALPENVPLADLIPVLVQRVTLPSRPGRSGRRMRGRALTGDGDWVLQRLGSPPLEEDLTPAALQIRDGETLHLRPREAQLPPTHFDDLIDGLATGIRSRSDRWRDSMTRGLFLLVCAIVLTVAFVLLVNPAFVGRMRVAAALTVTLIVGAMLCSRALADRWAGLTLGLAALPFAALTGYLVPPRTPGGQWVGPAILCATVAVSVVAMFAVAVIVEHRAVFLALWLATVAGTVGALLVALGMSAAQVAGAVVTLALIASAFAPGVAFRLARMRLPQLPTGSADLADDIEPFPAQQVMAGAVAADTYLTWLTLAVGLVCLVGLPILALDHRWPATALVVSVSLVLIIRARGLTSAWQRAAVLVPAVVGLSVLAVSWGNHTEPATRTLLVPGLLMTAGILLAFSRTMPGRRLLPYWGRIADIFEYVFAIATVILLLVVFDAFTTMRAMAG
jgi:type VII secretion integral membrane protein EccD